VRSRRTNTLGHRCDTHIHSHVKYLPLKELNACDFFVVFDSPERLPAAENKADGGVVDFVDHDECYLL
jgi:hypothetical protein